MQWKQKTGCYRNMLCIIWAFLDCSYFVYFPCLSASLLQSLRKCLSTFIDHFIYCSSSGIFTPTLAFFFLEVGGVIPRTFYLKLPCLTLFYKCQYFPLNYKLFIYSSLKAPSSVVCTKDGAKPLCLRVSK